MSGATGAGPSGTSTGTDTGDGGRGSAARAADPQTTNLKPVKSADAETPARGARDAKGAAGTDGRGKQARGKGGAGTAAPEQDTASPLPGERQTQQQAGPYHPPQAYPAQQGAAAGAAVRRPRTGARTVPRVRKARLRVAKADPWSVMKVSFLLSIALGICTIVAAAVLWMVMDAMGVFSTVGGTISEATGSNESNGFDLQAFLSLPNVLMFTSIIAVIDVVLATALATLGAFIYNLSAGFVGGVELTLAEDE
ncbi:DUF3566 domain-containing protein [Streptomyces sp. NPDC017943]|uniref:DUF3566 domain-containing protein n=1 Tax=Streptomyces sp. NPDC017943 TaxID=3365019 RepID=UPI0037B36446